MCVEVPVFIDIFLCIVFIQKINYLIIISQMQHQKQLQSRLKGKLNFVKGSIMLLYSKKFHSLHIQVMTDAIFHGLVEDQAQSMEIIKCLLTPASLQVLFLKGKVQCNLESELNLDEEREEENGKYIITKQRTLKYRVAGGEEWKIVQLKNFPFSVFAYKSADSHILPDAELFCVESNQTLRIQIQLSMTLAVRQAYLKELETLEAYIPVYQKKGEVDTAWKINQILKSKSFMKFYSAFEYYLKKISNNQDPMPNKTSVNPYIKSIWLAILINAAEATLIVEYFYSPFFREQLQKGRWKQFIAKHLEQYQAQQLKEKGKEEPTILMKKSLEYLSQDFTKDFSNPEQFIKIWLYMYILPVLNSTQMKPVSDEYTFPFNSEMCKFVYRGIRQLLGPRVLKSNLSQLYMAYTEKSKKFKKTKQEGGPSFNWRIFASASKLKQQHEEFIQKMKSEKKWYTIVDIHLQKQQNTAAALPTNDWIIDLNWEAIHEQVFSTHEEDLLILNGFQYEIESQKTEQNGNEHVIYRQINK